MADRVWKGDFPLVFGHSYQLSLNKFFDPSTPSMRKHHDGEKKYKEGKKIVTFIVVTNVVASQPPRRSCQQWLLMFLSVLCLNSNRLLVPTVFGKEATRNVSSKKTEQAVAKVVGWVGQSHSDYNASLSSNWNLTVTSPMELSLAKLGSKDLTQHRQAMRVWIDWIDLPLVSLATMQI